MSGTVWWVRRLGGYGSVGVVLVSLLVVAGPETVGAGPASATSSATHSAKLSAKHSTRHSPKAPTPQAEAKAALLTLSDMPTGWVAISKIRKTSHTAPLSRPLAKCIGVSASVATTKPLKVSSPDFTSSDRTAAVEDSVSVYKSVAQAKTAYRAMARPETPTCMGSLGGSALRTSIQAEAGASATVGAITISPLPPGAVMDGQTGFIVDIPLTADGKDLTITSTQVDFEKGKLLQQVTFNGNGTPFSSLVQEKLLGDAGGQT